MVRYLFVLTSLLYILGTECMEPYIEGRRDFVHGKYNTCIEKMSDIILHSPVSAVAAYAKTFLYVFFSRMKEEDNSLNLASSVDSAVKTASDDLTLEKKQSLSLTATSRGKLLLESDNWDQAKKWLFTARDLDGTNADAACYLQDIKEVIQPQITVVYPAFESIDLGD